MKVEHEENEMSIIRQMCGIMLKESNKNTQLSESLGLELGLLWPGSVLPGSGTLPGSDRVA